MATSESIRIKSLPKSKMQTIREFTGLRAFVEIDDSGNAVGYFIQDPEAKTFETPLNRPGKQAIRRPRKNRVVASTEQLVRGKNQASNPYSPHSVSARAHAVITQLLPASRGSLQDMLVDQLNLTQQQATSQLSYMINCGHTLAPVE